MPNPAASLLEIFELWNLPGNPAGVRAMHEPSGIDTHIRATKLLHDIQIGLDELESTGARVQVYRDALPSWLYLIMAFPYGWQDEAASANLHAGARLDLLEALSDRLQGRIPTVDESKIGQLDDFLDSIDELLRTDPGIPLDLQRHIAGLLARIRAALQSYRESGIFEGGADVAQLWVAMGAAEARSKDRKKAWRAAADKIIAPTVVGFLVGAPGWALTAMQITAAAGH